MRIRPIFTVVRIPYTALLFQESAFSLPYPCRPLLAHVSPAGRLAPIQKPRIQRYHVPNFHIPARFMTLPERIIQGFLADSLLPHVGIGHMKVALHNF